MKILFAVASSIAIAVGNFGCCSFTPFKSIGSTTTPIFRHQEAASPDLVVDYRSASDRLHSTDCRFTQDFGTVTFPVDKDRHGPLKAGKATLTFVAKRPTDTPPGPVTIPLRAHQTTLVQVYYH